MTIRRVLQGGRVPVKVWTDDVEPSAEQQLRNVAGLPFVFKHVAAMPDAHWGMGATVGSVIATRGAIVPAAVGVDIGCGMMAVETTLPVHMVLDSVRDLRARIEAKIPVGHHGNAVPSDDVHKWLGWREPTAKDMPTELLGRAFSQLGSLGGGNHFIEVCKDTQGAVWIMLHSGSRNVGKVLATKHIDTARGLMRKMFIELPDPDLAYFVQGTPEFGAYIADLLWAQSYAAENRRTMMGVLLSIMREFFGEFDTGTVVNCHHNYAAQEHHYGENVWITRKGAVRARREELGIIPGSMGAGSYIVEGLGNAESFESCSHGAGRKMGRNEAKRSFTVQDLEAQTQGVECRKDSGVLDEIPGAYKDIDEVMANQMDLVRVVASLKQIVCVKG